MPKQVLMSSSQPRLTGEPRDLGRGPSDGLIPETRLRQLWVRAEVSVKAGVAQDLPNLWGQPEPVSGQTNPREERPVTNPGCQPLAVDTAIGSTRPDLHAGRG
jgi:hypothetical protein